VKDQEEEQQKISEFLFGHKKNMNELKRLRDGFDVKMDYVSKSELKQQDDARM
jgi:hypothetical protein